MDLGQALKALSAFADKYSNEELLEAKKVFQDFERSINSLNDLYVHLDGKKPSKILELLNKYEEIKQEILDNF